MPLFLVAEEILQVIQTIKQGALATQKNVNKVSEGNVLSCAASIFISIENTLSPSETHFHSPWLLSAILSF